jgi:replicative DNA helicase
MMRQGRSLADLTLKRGEVFGTGDYHRAMNLYNQRVLQGRGPSIGYKELDDHFNGLVGVTFLMAPPKTYKSWVTINAVLENAMQGGFPYLYSLELPAEETDFRLRCMAAGVPYWKYLKRCLTPDDLERINTASSGLDESGVYRIEKPGPGERGVDRMVDRALNAGASVIFIDQLQYMETRKGVNLGSANNTGDYWEVCNDLRDYSDEIPIFVVHQFNRSVMSAKEMPEMQQAKGSSAIEETATLALGLWANKEMRKNNTVHLGTLASRNYGYGTWEVGVQLSYGCALNMIGLVDDREDED